MLNLLNNHPIVPVTISETPDTRKKSLWSVFKRKQENCDLYFGGQYNSAVIKRLKALGITAIINMRSQIIHLKTAESEFNYLHLPTLDNNPPDIELLIKGVNFIDDEIKNGGKVYINCLKGLGRSPTLALAYLMKKGKSFDEAHSQLKSLRPEISISVFQEMKLKELEEHYKSRYSYLLQDRK